ncbi:MAG: KpsF/GutQ family sugar-phosphate isomerase [Zoogloeaceae bacterium]|jgi:arabinose-5-phosphate isomerase|nr:KpsF/GutQ family sugar-phosphate isomerase [Zoogloeaceae bacterium]
MPQKTSVPGPARAIELAARTLQIEADAITALIPRINADFVRAVDLILAGTGRVIVSGMGKSGHIARKIAATLASTGTPAYFVHPGEASHGDLGMVQGSDVFLALSNSGETEEVLRILPAVRRQGARLIALTGNPASTLATAADAHLDASVAQEACPLNLAPTASTTAALALGDALAVALLDARGFGPEDFALSHPGGSLGRRLLTYVRDVMHPVETLPVVSPDAPLSEAILAMSKGGLGMTVITDAADRILGIFTDGDLRRAFIEGVDLRTSTIGTLMHPHPWRIAPDKLAVEAVELMERHRVNQILVADNDAHLLGALNMHDLFAAKVI